MFKHSQTQTPDLSHVFGPATDTQQSKRSSFQSENARWVYWVKIGFVWVCTALVPRGPHMGRQHGLEEGHVKCPPSRIVTAQWTGVSEGKGKKSNSSFSSWPGEPFSLPARSGGNPHSRRPAPGSSRSSLPFPVIVFLSGPTSSNSAPWKLFLRQKRTSSIIGNLGPFFSLSLTLFFFLSFPTELGYLIFLRRSRCHLPLMVETMEKSLQPECQALLNASSRFEDGSWKSLFQPLCRWPPECRSFCVIACLPPGQSQQRWLNIKESGKAYSSERPWFKSRLRPEHLVYLILWASVFLPAKFKWWEFPCELGVGGKNWLLTLKNKIKDTSVSCLKIYMCAINWSIDFISSWPLS